MVFVVAAGVACPAGPGTSCTLDPRRGVAEVTLTQPGDAARLVRVGSAITLDGDPCENATVTNTDRIVVRDRSPGSTEVTVDLFGGPFVPGATREGPGSSEIEVRVDLGPGPDALTVTGSPGADHLVIGLDGINLNGEEGKGIDRDVTFLGSPAIRVHGGGGDDVLSPGPEDRVPVSGA